MCVKSRSCSAHGGHWCRCLAIAVYVDLAKQTEQITTNMTDVYIFNKMAVIIAFSIDSGSVTIPEIVVFAY